MKHFRTILFFALLVNITSINAQQKVAVTVILQNNFCQAYYNHSQTSSKIEYQIAGLTNESSHQFSAELLKSEGVVSSSMSSTTNKGMFTGKLEVNPQTNLEQLKNIFIKAGVAFVNVENEIFQIENWKSFTEEQCTKLSNFNQIIYNIETKRNWILNNPAEKEKAEQNGWFTKNDEYLNKAVNDKKEFLQSIK